MEHAARQEVTQGAEVNKRRAKGAGSSQEIYITVPDMHANSRTLGYAFTNMMGYVLLVVPGSHRGDTSRIAGQPCTLACAALRAEGSEPGI
jgi:hypothetical protein